MNYPYSKHEENELRRLWPLYLKRTITAGELARAMGRSIDSLRGKAERLKLPKEYEARASLCDEKLIRELLKRANNVKSV